MRSAAWVMCLLGSAAFAPAEEGAVVFENARLRAVLGPDAVWRSLADKATGRECLPKGARAAFAVARVAGKTHAANVAARAGDRLTLAFAGCDTKLTYEIATTPDWIAFRLAGVSGGRPSHLTLVRVPVAITRRVGPRLSAAWDDRTAVCLMAVNLRTQARARRRGNSTELAATTQDAPGPKLEGAGAALLSASPADLRAIGRKLAAAYGLPRNEGGGVPSKRLPLARQSYWFFRFGERDVDKVIEYCRRTGFRQVMMSSGSWCRTVGHYTFRKDQYPGGLEGLRRTVAKLHKHGILVGMHCYASKISKADAYVTPIPDRRFWVDRTAALAAAVGPKETTIRTASDLSQWPGSPVAGRKTWEGGVAKHREAIIDDEIIQYRAIGPEGKWDTFLGCRRGAWGTKAAGHKAAAACRHYGVDGCINGYIVDQETSLLDEATSRLAHVFNTCGFDMVYFDGGEDVDRRRFTHYVSKFQATAMSKFKKRPLVHMGTIMTHGLWHSFTRSATVDTYWNTIRGRIIAGGEWAKLPTVKEHIDRSVAYMLRIGDDMMPGELGWFGIWPKGRGTDGLQLDEIEYLMCKSLAYDAPISLQTSFARMEAHPLTPGILEIVRAYEKLRLARTVPEATRARLRQTGKDFLLVRQDGRPHFVEAKPAGNVAGGTDLRAMVGRLGGNTVAAVWHYLGKHGRLTLSRAGEFPGVLRVDASGKQPSLPGIIWEGVTITEAADPEAPPTRTVRKGSVVFSLGSGRTLMVFLDLAPDAVRMFLAKARFEPRKPAAIWLQAEDAQRFAGKMAKGSAVGVREAGAFGDVVVCTTRPDRAGGGPRIVSTALPSRTRGGGRCGRAFGIPAGRTIRSGWSCRARR